MEDGSMAASRILGIMTDSVLDGITGAALFGKLRRPGAPTVLVDTSAFEEVASGPADVGVVDEIDQVPKIGRSADF
jgi:hypothetical protein